MDIPAADHGLARDQGPCGAGLSGPPREPEGSRHTRQCPLSRYRDA